MFNQFLEELSREGFEKAQKMAQKMAIMSAEEKVYMVLDLKEKLNAISNCPFKPGDIVTTKKGQGRYAFPAHGVPAIVAEVRNIKEITEGETDGGKDPEDMVILVFFEEHENFFKLYSVQSDHFELWK